MICAVAYKVLVEKLREGYVKLLFLAIILTRFGWGVTSRCYFPLYSIRWVVRQKHGVCLI
jgi:hypothetical protein